MVGVLHDSDLKKNLERLAVTDDRQARGKGFEQYVRQLLSREHFKVTVNPRGARPRQVDLMASRHDVTYLVETTWERKRAGVPDIDDLYIRLAEVEPSVIGVLVSWSGFAKPAIRRVLDKRSRPVLLVTGEELKAVDSLVRLLRRKYEHLVTNGEVVFGIEQPRHGAAGTHLPVGSDHFVDRSGTQLAWVTGAGEYGHCLTLTGSLLPALESWWIWTFLSTAVGR